MHDCGRRLSLLGPGALTTKRSSRPSTDYASIVRWTGSSGYVSSWYQPAWDSSAWSTPYNQNIGGVNGGIGVGVGGLWMVTGGAAVQKFDTVAAFMAIISLGYLRAGAFTEIRRQRQYVPNTGGGRDTELAASCQMALLAGDVIQMRFWSDVTVNWYATSYSNMIEAHLVTQGDDVMH
jgi:hypothetical protein